MEASNFLEHEFDFRAFKFSTKMGLLMQQRYKPRAKDEAKGLPIFHIS